MQTVHSNMRSAGVAPAGNRMVAFQAAGPKLPNPGHDQPKHPKPVIRLPRMAQLMPTRHHTGYLPPFTAPLPAVFLAPESSTQQEEAGRVKPPQLQGSVSPSLSDLQQDISSSQHWTQLDDLLTGLTSFGNSAAQAAQLSPKTPHLMVAQTTSTIKPLALGVLEQLVLKHRHLHGVTVCSIQDNVSSRSGPQPDWEACGRRLSKAMQRSAAAHRVIPRAAPPAGVLMAHDSKQQSVSALDACAKGQPAAAIGVLVAMAHLPHTFHCRRYVDRVLKAYCTACLETSSPACLAALLSACHQLKHPVAREQLSALVHIHNQHVHHMDSRQLARSTAALLALSKVLQVHSSTCTLDLKLNHWCGTPAAASTRLALDQGRHHPTAAFSSQQQVTDHDADVTQDHQSTHVASPGLLGTDQPRDKPQPDSMPQLMLIDLYGSLRTAVDRLGCSLEFQGLAPGDLAALLDELHRSAAALPSTWLDAATTASMRTFKARHGGEQQPHQESGEERQSGVEHTTDLDTETYAGPSGHIQGMLDLMCVLANLGFQPAPPVTRWLMKTLQAALPAPLSTPHLLPHLVNSPPDPPKPTLLAKPAEIDHRSPALISWDHASSDTGSSGVHSGLSSPAGAAASAGPTFLTPYQISSCAAHLAQLRIMPGGYWCAAALAGLLAHPIGGSSSHACQLVGLLPELLGPSQHVRQVWVRHQLPALELLVSHLSSYLAAASADDLTVLAVGCAAIRFHPGEQFLSWHAASCQKKIKAFEPSALVQLRGAYTSLNFRPETRLAQMLHVAVKHVLYSKHLQMRRASAAVQVALEATSGLQNVPDSITHELRAPDEEQNVQAHLPAGPHELHKPRVSPEAPRVSPDLPKTSVGRQLASSVQRSNRAHSPNKKHKQTGSRANHVQPKSPKQDKARMEEELFDAFRQELDLLN